MEDVGKKGRTVLFVSHNMAAINALCKEVLFLKSGLLAAQGTCNQVIQEYMRLPESESEQSSIISLEHHPCRTLDSLLIFKKAEVFCDNERSTTLLMGGNLKIIVYLESDVEITNPRFGISIEDITGQRLINFSPSHQAPSLLPKSIFKGKIICDIPCLPLLPGVYY
ncbi:MAG: hypothetical protein ACKPFA_09720, partial [Dolichospermum sp.]